MSSSPPRSAEELEALFRGVPLAAAGFEVSDGVPAFHVSLDEPMRCCVWGKVYEIRQTLHVFCLDFHAVPDDASAWTWTLYFEPLRRTGEERELTARELTNAMFLFATPDEVEWRQTVEGRWSAANGFSMPR
jgi:hypothetical protein